MIFFFFNLAPVIFNSTVMSSHLLRHLPSSRSQAAFQASPGIPERDGHSAPPPHQVGATSGCNTADAQRTQKPGHKHNKSSRGLKQFSFSIARASPSHLHKEAIQAAVSNPPLSWPGDGHDDFTAMQGVTITHCGPTRTTRGQITTRTAGERQTRVTFEKGRVSRITPTVTNQGSVGIPPSLQLKHPCKAKGCVSEAS